MSKPRRGDVREDGRLFWCRSAYGRETWLWPVAFGLMSAKSNAHNRQYRELKQGRPMRVAQRPTEPMDKRDVRIGDRDALGRYFIGYANSKRERGRWGSLEELEAKRAAARVAVFALNEKQRLRRDMARGFCKWYPKTKIKRPKAKRACLSEEQKKLNNAEGRRRWKRAHRAKLKIDPVLRAMEHHRLRVRHFIRGKASAESTGVGCKREFFKAWMEEQFAPGMTWANYGRVWSVDHIIPQSWFKKHAHARRYLMHHYTNLRPLGVFENGSRSDRVTRSDLSLAMSRVPDEWREELFQIVFANAPVLENSEEAPPVAPMSSKLC